MMMLSSVGNLTRLATLHYTEPPTHDKVWGAAVQRNQDGNEYRYVAFWGKTGRPVTLRPYTWTTLQTAIAQMNRVLKEKEREGYVPIAWQDRRYGLVEVVKDLSGSWGGDAVPQAAQAAQREEARPPKTPKKPVETEQGTMRPALRRRRELNLE